MLAKIVNEASPQFYILMVPQNQPDVWQAFWELERMAGYRSKALVKFYFAQALNQPKKQKPTLLRASVKFVMQ